MWKFERAKEEMRDKILGQMDYSKEVTDEEIREMIGEAIERERQLQIWPVSERRRLAEDVFCALRRWDILQKLLEDDKVTEIMVNGPEHIFVEREGMISEFEQSFSSAEQLRDVIQRMAAGCNRSVNEASPIVDARLENGARVNIVLQPVAINGPVVTIRRFPDKPIDMEQLIGWGSISRQAAECLEALVAAGYNILISGGTGCGKTTFLNALSHFIPPEQRVITIEDSAELQIQGIRNLIRLETRNANVEGCQPIGIRELIRTALRMRPEAIHNDIVSYKVTKRVSPSHTHSLSTDLTMAFFSSAENASKFSRRCTISFFLSLALRSSRAAMRSSAARDRCSAFKDWY